MVGEHTFLDPQKPTPSLGTGMQITAWRLPSWEHDSNGEDGVKGTEEADTPFRI